jgi:hypothetical protein
MVLSIALWLILLPTVATGILLLKLGGQIAQKQAQKAPVPVRVRSQRR